MIGQSGAVSVAEHERELGELTQRLRDAGWASHVTATRLLESWEKLASEVANYALTIDDFTNDLTGRDGLQLVLGWASPALVEALGQRVDAADHRYRACTTEDGGAALSRYFRSASDPASGWWWHRKPTTGPLAEYIDRHAP